MGLDRDEDSSQKSKSEPARLRAADGGGNLNRLVVGAGAVALLLINLAVGLFAREQQRAIITKAIEIYDTAFVSSNYIHHAQVSFQHFVDDRLLAIGPEDIASANVQLSGVLDELDVVIERAPSSRVRDEDRKVRAQIEALSDARESVAQLRIRLLDIQAAMERLDQRTTTIGLHARDEIDDLSKKNDFVLLGSIATSVLLAGLTLALLRHAVARSTMARMNSYGEL